MEECFIHVGAGPSIVEPGQPSPLRAVLSYPITLLTFLCLICLATGCASNNIVLGSGTVGRERSSASTVSSNGVLVVYTPLEDPINSQDEFASPQRSSYRLVSANGAVSKCIDNCDSVFDDQPKAISLPAGSYTVDALGPKRHPVSVAVRIVAGETTPVYLDGSEHQPEQGGKSNLITFSNGVIVGSRAQNP